MRLDGRKSEQGGRKEENMKQGETKRLKPKDKHLKASWKKRDEGRKGKQEAYVQEAITRADAEGDSLTYAIEQGFLEQEQS